MRLLPLSTLFVISALFLGCSSDTSNNQASNTNSARTDDVNSNSAKDSVDDLRLTIKLPFEPEEATWKDASGKLTAVLLYSSEDATKFSSHLAAQGQSNAETIQAEDWFPAELLSQSDIGGESILKGQSYNAGDVLQPPYTAGRVVRITDSNYFIVQLTTK